MSSTLEDKGYIPFAFKSPSESSQVIGYDEAMRYLQSSTVNLDRERLEDLAHSMESQGNINPEVRFYAGWAFLDAAYPGLFSLADSPVEKTDSDSIKLAEQGFKYFRQLDSRVIYLDKNLPVERLANQEIKLSDVIVGIKARIIDCFDELLTSTPKGETSKSIRSHKKEIAIKIAEKLELTGKQIREQIQITESLINYGRSRLPEKSLNSFLDNLRGIEAECALLGAVWAEIAYSPDSDFGTIALPASVRTDYALNKSEPKGDVILYHEGEKFAVEIARSKVSSARYHNNPVSNGRTIHFFGDRDLRLPSLQKNIHGVSKSPKFQGYKQESRLVMHQLKKTADRLLEIENN